MKTRSQLPDCVLAVIATALAGGQPAQSLLIENAADPAPSGPKVTLTVKVAPGMAVQFVGAKAPPVVSAPAVIDPVCEPEQPAPAFSVKL